MAEGTYEFECMRAELLGIDKPDQEEFEKARQERLVQEQTELEAAQANLVEEQDESLKNAGGKLEELNSILSSTQQKLNRFKQTACGSLSNIFGRGSIDLTTDAVQMAAASSSTSSRRNTTASGGGGGGEANKTSTAAAGINEALDNLDEMQHQNADNDVQPIISTEKIRNAKLDIQKKMVSHLDKLDSLINQADQAEIAMTEQTKQMKKFTK